MWLTRRDVLYGMQILCWLQFCTRTNFELKFFFHSSHTYQRNTPLQFKKKFQLMLTSNMILVFLGRILRVHCITQETGPDSVVTEKLNFYFKKTRRYKLNKQLIEWFTLPRHILAYVFISRQFSPSIHLILNETCGHQNITKSCENVK